MRFTNILIATFLVDKRYVQVGADSFLLFCKVSAPIPPLFFYKNFDKAFLAKPISTFCDQLAYNLKVAGSYLLSPQVTVRPFAASGHSSQTIQLSKINEV